ncbi:MAG: hypothetical protein HY880_00260 [Deltaproteobacteria bacterium]|nr:hypothetical protein [Deltaproteobacteria bacterium]
MKIRLMSFFLAGMFLFAGYCFALDEGAIHTVVEAKGTIVSGYDHADTRNRSIDAALRTALETALSSFMTADLMEFYSEALEIKIYANSRAYIVNYKIVSEGRGRVIEPLSTENTPTKDSYSVVVEAGVDMVRLKKDVRMMTSQMEESNVVSMVLLDAKNYTVFESLKSMLLKMENVKAVTLNSLYRDMFVMDVEIVGTPVEFARTFEKMAGDDFDVVPAGAGRIMVKESRSGRP